MAGTHPLASVLTHILDRNLDQNLIESKVASTGYQDGLQVDRAAMLVTILAGDVDV